jgi:hypothetical protein
MFSQMKRRIGVFAAVAVMAALVPAIASSPASATTSLGTTGVSVTVVGSAATYSACPAGSAAAAGFTDTTSTDVDCIAMYGITTGTTATTYSPTDSVPRWAMALYLTRALGPAGGTLGAGVDQGFTDISGKSAEIVLAIDQLAELGISLGKTATTFAPDDNVTREEMAMFIERWLENVKAGPGGQSDADGLVAAATTTYVTSDCNTAVACTGKYNYTDVDAGSVTVEGANAIKELYDMGIHDGVSATTFNPSSDMTRAAMATFLTAALDHTNARPAGLTIQASLYTNAGAHTPTLSVSDRDASFNPVSGTPVDVFYWTTSTTEGNAAFGATGLCDDSVASGASITKCKIDTGEPTTNVNGNVTPTGVQTDPVATIYPGSDVYYAWTAASGTTYDNDLHGSGDDYSTITVGATAAAAGVQCTMDTPANALTATAAHTVAFGVTTTVTCQVKNGNTAASGNVAKALQKVKYTNTRTFTTDSSSVQSGVIMTEEIVGSTDANGQVQFTITGPTDTAGTDVVTDVVTVEGVTITAVNNASILASVSGHMTTTGAVLGFSLAYTDTTAAAATSSLTANSTSGLANAVTGLTRTYTGTVYDQYGGTVSGNATNFNSTSTLPGGLACTVATPTVCTTLAVHGLGVGDDVIFTGIGAFRGGIGDVVAAANVAAAGATATAGSSYVVATVPSTTSFTLDDAAGNDLGGSTSATAAASTDASPIIAVTSSTANAARTTSTDGTIAYSWTDTEGTSGKDTIAFIPTTATGATKAFYRLAATASFTSTDANGDDATDSETYAKLVEWDGTNDDFILEITDDADASNSVLSYMQYTFDANDHFATAGAAGAGNLNGTSATMAAWETAMGTASLTTGGAANDVVYVVWAAGGISTDINRFTQN